MATTSTTSLSDVITSVARGVSEANALLNTDPTVSMTLTTFEINTSFTAVVHTSVPASSAKPFKFVAASGGTYRVVAQPRPLPSSAKLQLFHPEFRELFIPSTRTESLKVQIRAVLEAVAVVASP